MRRRHFLFLSSASVGGLLIYTLDRKVSVLRAQDTHLQIPLKFFTESEALVIASATSRILPTDDSGVGAREAGVTIYIDRQLAGSWGRDRYRYTQAPFEEASPEFGYQGKATPREIYRQGLKKLKGFAQLSTEAQDQALREIESTLFFSLLRQQTIEGMFSDPIHGGNINMVGWQLVGFPGPRMSNYDDIDKHYGEAFRPQPTSLRQLTGMDIPQDDEK
jgi:gluconate 2-dehydrogenase gamma chain